MKQDLSQLIRRVVSAAQDGQSELLPNEEKHLLRLASLLDRYQVSLTDLNHIIKKELKPLK